MNKTIKMLAHAVAIAVATQIPSALAESYTVKPGDALSQIAIKTRDQSNGLLNKEQIMLTLYLLNQHAFINGDIDRLIVNKQLQIPENAADFLQISKLEASNRLREHNFAELSLPNPSTPTTKPSSNLSSNGVGSQEYAEIVQRLNTHQQNIEMLKIENAHITRNFKLLERALGRVVLVQGLMTNDLLKVKTSMTGSNGKSSDNTLSLESVKPIPEANTLVDNAMPAAGNTASDLNTTITPTPTAATPEPTAAKPIAIASPTPASINSKTPAQAIEPETPVDNNAMFTWLMALGLLLPLSLALIWFTDFRQIRSRRFKTQEAENEPLEINVTAKEKLASSLESNRYTTSTAAAKHENNPSTEAGKLSLENFAAELGGLANDDTELLSALELLDMCLLFGDYKQAHAVATQAKDQHKDSTVLARKLAFIERKLAKA